MMHGRTLLLILAAVAFSAAGQRLLESGVCWLYVLRVAPLSRAYLLSSLTYVVVPLAGVYVFGERLRLLHAVGMVLILAGVACLLSGD